VYSEWFEAVEQVSNRAPAAASASWGGTLKIGKPVNGPPGSASGVSMWQMPRSAAVTVGPHTTPPPPPILDLSQ
jgi:hypothetical protein